VCDSRINWSTKHSLAYHPCLFGFASFMFVCANVMDWNWHVTISEWLIYLIVLLFLSPLLARSNFLFWAKWGLSNHYMHAAFLGYLPLAALMMKQIGITNWIDHMNVERSGICIRHASCALLTWFWMHVTSYQMQNSSQGLSPSFAYWGKLLQEITTPIMYPYSGQLAWIMMSTYRYPSYVYANFTHHLQLNLFHYFWSPQSST
jgi:hypothetical protein